MTRKTGLGVLGALLLAACTPREEAADTTMGDTLGVGAAAPGATVPAATDTGARTVHVVLNEWRVSPSETTLDAGRVMFHAMNEGEVQHGLEVEGQGQEGQTGNIPAGGTGSVTMSLQPGNYTLYCPIVDARGNHRQMGMETTITVR